MNVAVLQSNYIPWKGYFDIIHDVEQFIFYDDLQFTKNDWRNRNLIKTPKGTEWLSIPVGSDIHRLICDVQLNDASWQQRHWSIVQQHYRKTPHFAQYRPFFEEVYEKTKWDNLSVLNQHLITAISRDLLGIKTTFIDSRSLKPEGTRQDRLLDVLKKAGATTYVSGPAAKEYIKAQRFEEAGIKLVWKDYSGYPEYSLYPPFTHGVTVLDLLFHTGPDAPQHIWGWRDKQLEAGK